MNKSKSITKIERILNKIRENDFDDSHIDVLFVTLRELPKSTVNIREIGAFVAHGNVRDQGLINDIMLRNHLFISMSFGIDHQIIDYQKNQFPRYLPELARLQLKLFNDEQIKNALNLKGGQIQRARANIHKKNAFLIDGDFCRLTEKLGKNEIALLNYSLNRLSAAGGIDYDTLIDEIMTLLEGDIEADLLSCLMVRKKEIFCHLLLLLHHVDFKIRKNFTAQTSIKVGENDIVSICGIYPVIYETGDEIKIMSPVFSSNYPANQIFDVNVTLEDIESNNLDFSSELEKIIRRNS